MQHHAPSPLLSIVLQLEAHAYSRSDVFPYNWSWTDNTAFDIATNYIGCVPGQSCLWDSKNRSASKKMSEPNNFKGAAVRIIVSLRGLLNVIMIISVTL